MELVRANKDKKVKSHVDDYRTAALDFFEVERKFGEAKDDLEAERSKVRALTSKLDEVERVRSDWRRRFLASQAAGFLASITVSMFMAASPFWTVTEAVTEILPWTAVGVLSALNALFLVSYAMGPPSKD